ncbi:MAG TPA: hypothetical protein VE732_03625 [Nitrososphaera sp.]|nr:hypothetical protein [Nitrososphaera sp.]
MARNFIENYALFFTGSGGALNSNGKFILINGTDNTERLWGHSHRKISIITEQRAPPITHQTSMSFGLEDSIIAADDL